MRSATEIERWNRKLHTYVGLCLLFFIWLFFFTGLLLNHSQWRFAEFWPNRKQSRQEYQIQPPSGGSDLTQARALMLQLGIVGEVEWTTTRADQSRFDFRISRPGHVSEVKADFSAGRATVERIDMNAWGVARILHNFTGVRMADRRNQRDWIFTELWAWAMDALAGGLIFMVLSSLYMWFELRTKRLWGTMVVSAGLLSCALFCVGLRWLY